MRARFARTLFLVTPLLLACGADEEPSPATQVSQALAAGAAASTAKDGSLEGLLPSEALGLPRTKQGSTRTGAAGFQTTIVAATYERGDRTIHLTITDAPTGATALAAANAWTMADFNRSTSTGFQRTTVIDGYRGLESWNGEKRRSEVSVFVANRFIFNVTGRGIETADLRTFVSSFGLGNLDRLATR